MYSGKRIRQARELYGWTQKQLATKLQVSQGAVAQLEGGFKQPSSEMIAGISRHARLPLSFFSNDPLIEFDSASVMFRAHSSMTRREMVEAKRYAEILFELFLFMADRFKLTTPNFPQVNDPERAAQETRKQFNVSREAPISNLTDLVERAGVVLLALPIDLKKRDAFSCRISYEFNSPNLPIIAISKNRPADRLRMTMAHELGHLALGHTQRLGVEQEKAANIFAAELLMPKNAIVRDFMPPHTLSRIAPLKPKWGVSVQALVRRAFELKVISERQYRYIFEQISINWGRLKEPPSLDIPTEKPRLLRQLAEMIYGKEIEFARLSADSQLSEELLKGIMSGYREKSASPDDREWSDSNVVPFNRRTL